MRPFPTVGGEEFERVLRESVLPAIHRGPSRVGQVTDLFVGVETDSSSGIAPRYVLFIMWSGLPGVLSRAKEIMPKLAEFCEVTERMALSVRIQAEDLPAPGA